MADQGAESEAATLKDDLMVLTKMRLNVFVLITAVFGFILASRFYADAWVSDFWLLIHMTLGTAAAAFGSAVFNQLMEVEHDRKMKRTQNRPLPASRIPISGAFILGWVLAALGIVQGAIPGALPPMIGWAAVSGEEHWWALPSWYLFAILFFWQLPHFVAINWFCREEYESAGYQMWGNGDLTGKKTARLALIFSFCLVVLCLLAGVLGVMESIDWFPGMGWVVGIGGTLASLQMCRMSVKFGKAGTKESAKKLFLYTLLYLPIILILLAVDWM